MTPYIWLDAAVGWGQSLWYSKKALGHPIEPVARLTRHVRRGKQFVVKLFNLLFQSATIVLIYLFKLDKRNTLWLRNMVRQTSLWEVSGWRRFAVGLAATDFPGMSAWPYRATIKYSYFIQLLSWVPLLFGVFDLCIFLQILTSQWLLVHHWNWTAASVGLCYFKHDLFVEIIAGLINSWRLW